MVTLTRPQSCRFFCLLKTKLLTHKKGTFSRNCYSSDLDYVVEGSIWENPLALSPAPTDNGAWKHSCSGFILVEAAPLHSLTTTPRASPPPNMYVVKYF